MRNTPSKGGKKKRNLKKREISELRGATSQEEAGGREEGQFQPKGSKTQRSKSTEKKNEKRRSAAKSHDELGDFHKRAFPGKAGKLRKEKPFGRRGNQRGTR